MQPKGKQKVNKGGGTGKQKVNKGGGTGKQKVNMLRLRSATFAQQPSLSIRKDGVMKKQGDKKTEK